jgi:hypothetical protein
VLGGQPLVVSGNGTVAAAAVLASPSVIGVAAEDTPINGRVTVYARGIVHETVATGTVTAGDQVGSSGTAGQVATVPVSAVDVGGAFVQATVNTAINAGLNAERGVLGVALTTATNPAKVRWMEF